MPSESSRSPIVTADSRLGQDLARKRLRTSVTSAACLGLPRKIGWPSSKCAESACFGPLLAAARIAEAKDDSGGTNKRPAPLEAGRLIVLPAASMTSIQD